MPTGVVARFDCRRGYGFVYPDDGGEDVFVHQNNIVMEGFRYLKPGEHVSYELEVGEKGLKAVQVALLDERPPESQPFQGGRDRDERDYRDRDRDYRDRDRDRDYRDRDRRDYRDRDDHRDREQMRRRTPSPQHLPRRNTSYGNGDQGSELEDLKDTLDKLRRKQERLISLLVAKGVIAPGDVDSLTGEHGTEHVHASLDYDDHYDDDDDDDDLDDED